MNTIMRGFYSLLIWVSSLELALAKKAPVRNHRNIEALQLDISEYERELVRLDLNL